MPRVAERAEINPSNLFIRNISVSLYQSKQIGFLFSMMGQTPVSMIPSLDRV